MPNVTSLERIPFELTYSVKKQLNLMLFVRLITGSIKAHKHIMATKQHPQIVYRSVVETPEQLLIRGDIYHNQKEKEKHYIERYLYCASNPVLHLDNNVVLGVKF